MPYSGTPPKEGDETISLAEAAKRGFVKQSPPDRLTGYQYSLEQLDYFSKNPENHLYMRDIAKQLADTMRENERLRYALQYYANLDDDAGIAREALSNKESDNG